MSDFYPTHKHAQTGFEVMLLFVANKYARRHDDDPPIAVFVDKTGLQRATKMTRWNCEYESI